MAAIFLSCAFLISAFQFSQIITAPTIRPLTFSLMLYWLYGFIMPGLFQSRNNDYFWRSGATSGHLADQAALIVFVASLFLFIGMSLTVRAGGADAGRIDPQRGMRPTLLLGIGLLLYCLFLLSWLGPAVYFLPRELAGYALRAAIGSGSSILGAFVRTFPMALSITMLGIALAMLNAGAPKWRAWTLVLIALGANLIVNFPTAIPRYYLVALLFVVLILGFPNLFRVHRVWLYIMAPIMLYMVFPILGRWNRGPDVGAASGQMSLSEYLADGDLDGFQSIMNAVFLTDLSGFSYGNRVLSSLFFFVPRSLWPGKAEPTGADAAEAAGYIFFNISMPLPGEFFADFGLIGVALGMFLFGLIIRNIETRFTQMGNSVSGTKVFVAVFAGFIPIVARGPLLSTAQAMIVALIAIWVWSKLSRVRTVRRKRGGTPRF